MLKVLSYILCDLDPKVKVIGQKAGICDGVPSTSALVTNCNGLFNFTYTHTITGSHNFVPNVFMSPLGILSADFMSNLNNLTVKCLLSVSQTFILPFLAFYGNKSNRLIQANAQAYRMQTSLI